ALLPGLGGDAAGKVRCAAARLVPVDDVVLDHEGGVQQLEGGSHLDRRLGPPAAEGLVRGQQQHGPGPLPALGRAGEGLPQVAMGEGGQSTRQGAAPAQQALDLAVDGGALRAAHEPPAAVGSGPGGWMLRVRVSSPRIWGTCSTAQGLSVHGARSTRAVNSSGATQRRSMTSSGFGAGAPSVVAMKTGQTSFSTIPEASTAR